MVADPPADFTGAVHDATALTGPELRQASWELWNIAVLPRVKARAAGEDLLTAEERDVLDLLSRVSRGFRAIETTAITGNSPTQIEFDMQEVVTHIHALQARVMSRAAARAYPRDFRLL